MQRSDVVEFIHGLENVQETENYGYAFFFVGDDHQRGFVTIADSDNEYDQVSNLNREGVYRVNIGIRKSTFDTLVGPLIDQPLDYTALNVFLPHPEYAKQLFVCILNPSGENAALTRDLIVEAHAIATERFQRRRRS